jgi:hypothetical protein
VDAQPEEAAPAAAVEVSQVQELVPARVGKAPQMQEVVTAGIGEAQQLAPTPTTTCLLEGTAQPDPVQVQPPTDVEPRTTLRGVAAFKRRLMEIAMQPTEITNGSEEQENRELDRLLDTVTALIEKARKREEL